MALNPPFLFFSLFLLLLPSFAFSRSFFQPETSDSELFTNVLDVSASLHQARHILSLNPKFLEQSHAIPANSPSSSSSSFSLNLHQRDSLLNAKPNHQDYQSLVLTRLARDSARVESITTKLRLAITPNFNQSDLNPTTGEETEIFADGLSTPVTSGTVIGSGEYLSRVGVGQPPKPLYMVLDTGSDVNWIQCKPCTDCYNQSDPIYDPTSSSSYSPLSCNSPQCLALEIPDCQNGKCFYRVNYGDGSFTAGEYAKETVSFGDAGSVKRVAIGCGHDNEGLFVGAAGVIGLGAGPLSFTSQIKATSFSYCLVDRDSGKSSTIDFNSVLSSDSVIISLKKNQKLTTFYYVELVGVTIGGEPVSIPPSSLAVDHSGGGGVIVDSGTSVTRLETRAYNSVRDAFVRLTRNVKPTGKRFGLFDTCYDMRSAKKVRVPMISFDFVGGKSLLLPAKNYLIPVNGNGTFCLAFAPSSTSLNIIGNLQQQGTRVSFDLVNSLIAFSPNKC